MNETVDITKYGNRSYVRAVHGTQFVDMPQYVDYIRQAGEEVPWTAAERGTHRPTNPALPYEY